MRVIVCGGREYANRERIAEVLGMLSIDSVIITGGAGGADTIANNEAAMLGFETEVFPADWKRHGRAAGLIRNQEMLDSGVDLVIAFPGRRGTADMIERAEKAGVEVRRFL